MRRRSPPFFSIAAFDIDAAQRKHGGKGLRAPRSPDDFQGMRLRHDLLVGSASHAYFYIVPCGLRARRPHPGREYATGAAVPCVGVHSSCAPHTLKVVAPMQRRPASNPPAMNTWHAYR